MPIVVDANLIAAAANREPAGARVIDRIASWYEAGEELHAPALLYYEVVSAIRKAVRQGRLGPGLASQAIAIAEAVPLTVHPPSRLTRVLEIAGALGRRRRVHRAGGRAGRSCRDARRLTPAGCCGRRPPGRWSVMTPSSGLAAASRLRPAVWASDR